MCIRFGSIVHESIQLCRVFVLMGFTLSPLLDAYLATLDAYWATVVLSSASRHSPVLRDTES